MPRTSCQGRIFTIDIAPGAGAKRGLRLSLLGISVCVRKLDSCLASWQPFIHFFLVGEQLLDARAWYGALRVP